MRSILVTICLLCTLYGCSKGDDSYQRVTYRSWDNCIKLDNGTVNVVINPTYGGQVLHYGFNDGDNVLWADSVINGWTIENYKQTRRSPDAGRFDVGYERKTEYIHDEIWAGEYSIIKGNRLELHIISDTCSKMGIIVDRLYMLHEDDTQLTVKQTMTNVSNQDVEYCFWTRTLLPAKGEYRTTCKTTSRYPLGYSDISLVNDALIEPSPDEERIRVENGVFIAYPSGSEKRYGINTCDGFSTYVYNGVAYTKHSDYFLGGKYENNNGETFPNMIYFNDDFIELEPHSTMVKLLPQESFSYLEKWTLNYTNI